MQAASGLTLSFALLCITQVLGTYPPYQPYYGPRPGLGSPARPGGPVAPATNAAANTGARVNPNANPNPNPSAANASAVASAAGRSVAGSAAGVPGPAARVPGPAVGGVPGPAAGGVPGGYPYPGPYYGGYGGYGGYYGGMYMWKTMKSNLEIDVLRPNLMTIKIFI